MRTVNRTFVRNSDGARVLSQVTQEEDVTLSGKEKKITRTTSNADANAQMQVVQREIQDTKQTSPNVTETKTEVSMPSPNGGLAPSMQIEQRETKRDDHLTEFKKSIMLPDVNGNMQTNEIRQGTISSDGKDRIKEESVLRPDNDGKFAVVEKTVAKETQNASGGIQSTRDTYSSSIPGGFVDSGLTLTERVSTVQSVSPDGKKLTVQRTESRNPGEPSDGLGVTEKTIDIVRPGLDGTAKEQRTIESSNSNGALGVVWVDTKNIATTDHVVVDTRQQSKSTAIPVNTPPTKNH
jgi:hypothetical protein